MVQPFKETDPIELEMRAVAEPVFDLVEGALDEFFQQGFEAGPFLLMLYDEGRMPFSDRINRDAFLSFIVQALANFPFTGNFESYLFILRSVFGEETDILFDIPTDGKLSISVNAVSDVVFQAVFREYIGSGQYDFFDFITSDGDEIQFRGISGINTAYDLQLLFSEIMPAGITPDISLEFFAKFSWIAEDDDGESDMVDSFGNTLIFVEIGG